MILLALGFRLFRLSCSSWLGLRMRCCSSHVPCAKFLRRCAGNRAGKGCAEVLGGMRGWGSRLWRRDLFSASFSDRWVEILRGSSLLSPEEGIHYAIISFGFYFIFQNLGVWSLDWKEESVGDAMMFLFFLQRFFFLWRTFVIIEIRKISKEG